MSNAIAARRLALLLLYHNYLLLLTVSRKAGSNIYRHTDAMVLYAVHTAAAYGGTLSPEVKETVVPERRRAGAYIYNM
eukprot:6355436-Pyramimonas_sp.AAC.1